MNDSTSSGHARWFRPRRPVALAAALAGMALLAAACGSGGGAAVVPAPGASPGQRTAAHTQHALNMFLKVSECMRAHGITNFPDPRVINGAIAVSLNGRDPRSPQFQSAQHACRSLGPGGEPHAQGGGS
jgi:hypothetical protein